MPPILTVPLSHTQLPQQPAGPAPFPSTSTDPGLNQKAQTVAKAKLKQRNRKADEAVINMPLNLAFEAGTVYNLQGFTPDADLEPWAVTDVQHFFKGKTGSTTRVTLRKTLNSY
jgi:hypothetical protein